MKKSLFCILLLAALSCAGIGWSHAEADASRDQLELTPVVELGDPAAAGQVELHFVDHMDERMFWDTTFVPGQPAETECTYLHQRYNYIPETGEYYLALELPFNTGVHFGSGDRFELEDDGPMTPLLNEVISRTKPGTCHLETVRTRDYFPELPMELYFQDPSHVYDYNYDLSHLKWQLENEYLMDEDRAVLQQRLSFMQALTALFRFPTPADHRLAIEVCKKENGSLDSYRLSEDTPVNPVPDRPFPEEFDSLGYEVNSTWIETGSRCIQTEEALFFIPILYSADGKLLDYSLTPGYGVYRLDLDREPLSTEGLSLALPLEPEQTVSSLTLDGTGTRLLLTTVTDDQATMHLLDADSGALLQSIPLGAYGEMTAADGEEIYLYYSYFTDGPLLLIKDSLGSFRFFVQQADGSYQFLFDGAFPVEDLAFLDGHLLDYRLAFDGKTLAFAGQIKDRDPNRMEHAEINNLPLLLWDDGGLLYGGLYQVSLERSPTLDFSYRTEPFTPARLELQFLS